jgi:hypothetical protein
MIKKCEWNKEHIKNRRHYYTKNNVFTVIVCNVGVDKIVFPGIANNQ